MPEPFKPAPHMKLVCKGPSDEREGFVLYPGLEDVKLYEVDGEGNERAIDMGMVQSITWRISAGEVASLAVEYIGAAIEADAPTPATDEGGPR